MIWPRESENESERVQPREFENESERVHQSTLEDFSFTEFLWDL